MFFSNRTNSITMKATNHVASFLAALYLLVAFNHSVILSAADQHGLVTVKDYIFFASFIIFLFILIFMLCSLLMFRHTLKPWLIFLVIGASAASYYMHSYHILIDKSMFQNIIETDYQEAKGLFSWSMVIYVLFLGVFPSAIIAVAPVDYQSLQRETAKIIMIVILSIIVIGLIAFVFYKDYSSLFRNNRHLRDQVIPINYIYSGYSYSRSKFSVLSNEIKPLGLDAHMGSLWRSSTKKSVTFVVVGETARASNFSLNGYERETNHYLKNQNVIYFNDVISCGTSTAISVPCMFSNLGRNAYDEDQAKHTENVLDVIRHSGLAVLWRDNNSGCKGVCDRVEKEDLSHLGLSELCNDSECFDPILLKKLQEKIDSYPEKGVVIVLHQKGSHGPAYYERVPKEFQIYQPFCHTNQIQECTRKEVINAYDNTIAYTDYTLSLMIDFLKNYEDKYDSSLIYMSDHGESLGENNLYLHGLPYAIAPAEQTHIPALIWLSSGFEKRFDIDRSCLMRNASRSYSHDNLFHSLLGMLNIETSAYSASLDIFQHCHRNSAS